MKTRSIVIVRGYSPGERSPYSPASTSFVKPRLNPDGKTTDDIFFHTHPWQEKNTVGFFNTPKNSCKPIGGDIDTVMAVKMIESQDGFDRTVTSIIGSRGYISITEASGIRLEESVLLDHGVSPLQLLQIKERLALTPPVWVKNYAKDETSQTKLVEIVETFYQKQKVSQNIAQEIKPFVRENGLDKLRVLPS